MVTAAPLLTVAICTHNRAALLPDAVTSVTRQINDDTDVLIVNNASTDDTPRVAAALAAAHPHVRVVEEPLLGLSYARNTALALAASQYVVFLDDDAVAEPGWLTSYRHFLERPPVRGIAAAGSVVHPRYDAPVPRWLPGGANMLDVGARAHPMTGRRFPWGCNFACNRARALAIGGFSPVLGRRGAELGAHEETDLFQRLRAAGYSIWWLPDAPIRHHIAPHKLRLGFHWYSALASGRSTVAVRMRERQGRWRRFGLLMGRLLTMPVLSAWFLLVAFVTTPFRGGQIAVKAVSRAARNLGIFWQSLLEAPHVLTRKT